VPIGQRVVLQVSTLAVQQAVQQAVRQAIQ
jgi:hypothetical protein